MKLKDPDPDPNPGVINNVLATIGELAQVRRQLFFSIGGDKCDYTSDEVKILLNAIISNAVCHLLFHFVG